MSLARSSDWAQCRKSWSEFIADRGLRLFTAAPQSIPRAPDVDVADVQAFAKMLREDDRALAAKLYFLVSPTLVAFVEDSLPKLLRALSHGSQARVVDSRGTVRGHLQWGATLRGRLTSKIDSGTFVVSQRFRSADIPENRLVRAVLEQVRAAAATVRSALGISGVPTKVDGSRSLQQLILDLDRATREALHHPYLRDVASVAVTSQMRQAARRRRGVGYKQAATLERRLAEVRASPLFALAALAQDCWLAPVSDDDLFELYVLVKVVDEIEGGLGFSLVRQYGLVRRDRDAVAEVEDKKGRRIIIYADQGMQNLVEDSEYVGILREYEDFKDGAAHRRPDIALRYRAKGVDRVMLLEMKRSDDSPYLRNGLYKVLGYLRDFDELWAEHPGKPKAVLVVPGMVSPIVKRTAYDAAIAGAEDSVRLRELIRDGLALNAP